MGFPFIPFLPEMAEELMQKLFTSIDRCRYLVEEGEQAEKISFKSMKAKFAGTCTVERAPLSFQDERFLLISATWSKPHYFLVTTENSNVYWIKGQLSTQYAGQMEKIFSVFTSLSSWAAFMRDLSLANLVIPWIIEGENCSFSDAKKRFTPTTHDA